jgi:hypothetical protein
MHKKADLLESAEVGGFFSAIRQGSSVCLYQNSWIQSSARQAHASAGSKGDALCWCLLLSEFEKRWCGRMA